jgi:cytochrome oxidase Cu insertion factor (SCO1/SenC/PrrC family)
MIRLLHLNPFEGEKAMKRMVALAGAVLLALGLSPFAALAQDQQPAIATTSLKVGDTAPDFTLLSDQRSSVSLSSFRGKKNVILAFYVLAFTSG